MIKFVLLAILSCFTLPLISQAAEERPKIGLVLGGGGALGLAHIGVLKELEKLQIPIDYIGGTSMGAVIAGMYASGMSPDEMEQQFIKLDWWNVLKDSSPYQYLDYRRKLDDQRFMGLEFGIKDWHLVYPPGMAYGQKLNNVLEGFTLNSAGITDFDRLNIPYRAVATDLRSGKSVVLKSGNLERAMRASMAVPGAFTPVRIGDMVLVDGGILDNIPVDVVKNMGADIIIAVDVGAASTEEIAQKNFRALGEVVARTYSLMQRPGQEEQLSHANLVIAPELFNISASQFQLVKKIIPIGQEAAEKLQSKLAVYSVDHSTFQTFLEKQRHKQTEVITISDILISGNKAVSDAAIRDRIKAKKGPLKIKTVHEDLNRIHGMGDFQTVTYDIEPTNGTHTLTYHTIEKFWGPTYLHFGTRVEVSSGAIALWSILLNYTRTQLNPLGGEVQIDFEGGGYKRYLKAEWYQPISWGEHMFIAPSLAYKAENIPYYDKDVDIADIDQYLAYGKLDAGISFFEYGELRIGLIGGHSKAEGNSGPIHLQTEDDTLSGATASLHLNQLDDPFFPTKGYRFNIDGLFAFEDMGSSETFSKVEAQALLPITIGSHTITPTLSGGSSLGTELPFYALFDIGGINSFAGYAPYQKRGNYYSIGSLGYRYQLGKLPPSFGNGLFAIARVDVGDIWGWNGLKDVQRGELECGALVGFGANTIIGACQIAVGKAESIPFRFYFQIGNRF